MRAIKEFLKHDRFAARNGIELLEVSDGHAKASMRIEDHHLNGINVVHGGALFTLADLALTAASNSHGTLAVAIDTRIWYVKAAVEGMLFAEAKEVSLNPRLATYSIVITDDSGAIVATLEGMVYRKKETISGHSAARLRPPSEDRRKKTAVNRAPAGNKRVLSKGTIRRALLKWFDATARDLPWRRTRDPYAIWISEIMLQQTQVATASPYYERFMRRFPTVEKLARARLDSVLKHWEGLGYYSRARNLHKAAKEIVNRFGGCLPNGKDELLTLPGIGAYTAGAIASIAFGRREPVVDGNVTRVLCRLFRIQADPKKSAVQKDLWSLAEALLPPSRAGDFNQALMELGSEVCLPRSPRCAVCPLSQACQARLHGDEAALPVRSPKKRIPCHTVVVGVIRRKGRILIDKRKPEGLLGGLWEFPGGKKERGETLEAALRREIQEELGIRIRIERRLTAVDHAYSHFRIRLHAFECTYVSGTRQCNSCTDAKWVRPADLDRYAFPAANTKIIRALRE